MGIIMVIVSYLPSEWVISKYKLAGAKVGDAESYGFMGEPVGISYYIDRWQFWEEAVIRKGYRTYSLDQFERFGGWGHSLPQIEKLDEGEEPVRHALLWKEKLEQIGRPKPEIQFDSNGTFSGTYEYPTTEMKDH